MYWENGGIAPRILDLGIDGGEWSASRPCHITPRERAPGTHWKGGWVGPRAVLDTVVGAVSKLHNSSRQEEEKGERLNYVGSSILVCLFVGWLMEWVDSGWLVNSATVVILRTLNKSNQNLKS